MKHRSRRLCPQITPMRLGGKEICANRRNLRIASSVFHLCSSVAKQTAALIVLMALFHADAAPLQTQNVFLIITDGFRWQAVFSGADEQMLTNKSGGVDDLKATRQEFWRDTPEARRAALLPFVWSEIAKRGQIYGNRTKGSTAQVTNGKRFSYPGYNEILTGAPDPRIDSNANKPNPNVTVFEWLNGRPPFHDRVVVFGTWEAFPWIFNVERSHLPIWPTWQPPQTRYEIAVPELVNDLRRDTTPMWSDITYDSFLFHAALDQVGR